MRTKLVLYGLAVVVAMLFSNLAFAQDEEMPAANPDPAASSRPEDLFDEDLTSPAPISEDEDEVLPVSPEPSADADDSDLLPPGRDLTPATQDVKAQPPAPQKLQSPRQQLLTPEEAQRAKPTGVATETLVGRGTQAEIVDKKGSVQKVDPNTLVVPNREVSIQPPADAGEEAGEGEGEGEGEGTEKAQKPDQKNLAEDEEALARKAKEQAEKKAATEAVRNADVQRLRELQHQGAYFYTEDEKPITGEELEKRIADGEVSGIKTVDIYMQRWSTASPPAEEQNNVQHPTTPE